MKLGQAMRVAKGEDYVISRYEEYLTHRDLALEGKHIFDLLQRPERNREGTWSASSAGRCLREQQLTYLGFPRIRPKARTLNIFANGDFVHLRHQAFGMVAGYVTAAEVPVSLPSWKLRGTMDGLLDDDSIFEVKSIHERGFSEVNSFGPHPEHIEQVHSYMLANEQDTARILYESKNTQSLKEFLVHRDETIIKSILTSLSELNDITDEKTLSPMLQECRNEKGRFNQCPHAQHCESATWPQPKLHIRITPRPMLSSGRS